jgi:nucleotide-binding universal stress UspA family protein
MAESTSTSFIVVGVDGSDASKDALRWAARQARMTGADLHAICAWDFPVAYGWAPDYSDVDFEGAARDSLRNTVEQVLGEAPDLPVVTRVERGHAAQVLVEASREADLLVVGRRGLGSFAGMLLGSVSEHCAQHARCPVLIMQHARH